MTAVMEELSVAEAAARRQVIVAEARLNIATARYRAGLKITGHRDSDLISELVEAHEAGDTLAPRADALVRAWMHYAEAVEIHDSAVIERGAEYMEQLEREWNL